MKLLTCVLAALAIACSDSGPSGTNDEPRGTVNGNVATFEGIVMTLTAHQEPWTDWEFEFMAPDPGHHYYTVMPRVVNGSSLQITVNPLDWQLEYSGSIRVDREGAFREPALSLSNVLPQDQVSGWLAFQVPDGAQVTGVLWSPEFDVTLKIGAQDIP